MAKFRKSKGRFAGVPIKVMDSADYTSLGANSKVLLLELAYQYNGKNNGDLTCAWTVLKKRGFKSEPTIHRAKNELLQRNLITLIRKGIAKKGVRLCALYAINWQALDEVFYKDGIPKHNLDKTIAPLRSFWHETELSEAEIKIPRLSKRKPKNSDGYQNESRTLKSNPDGCQKRSRQTIY